MSDENEQAEIIREFIIECLDQLDAVDNDLLALEHNPTDSGLLGKIFRAFHNMKGSSGFLGFHQLESLTHVGESLLSKMRDGQIILNSEITFVLIAMGDAVRDIFKAIEATGKDGNNDYLELKARLTAVMNNSPAPELQKKPLEPVKDALDLEIEEALRLAKERRNNQKNAQNIVIGENTVPNRSETQKIQPVAAEIDSSKSGDESKSVADSSIRVDIDVLDKMMNLVGELVLTRNQILQSYNPNENGFVTKSLKVLNRITTDLQKEVMKTRMQPINNIFSKFPRMVRSLAESVNKKINLEIEGKETELDRTLIDSLRDPLTHMVRNSVDHGIELPDKRVSNGKVEAGTITLKAYHESGLVHIDIIDDGGGIDPERIKSKAIEKGLITSEQASQMSEKDILNMIFLPGFSTAAVITNISGRGVGMDVVKTNIEKIGGTVDISSVVGQGSLFSLKVPLTLAIIPALIVGVENNRIAIPQVNLKELHRIEKEQLGKIENIHGTPIFHLRNESIPILNLDKELGLERQEKKADEAINIVILNVEDQMLGLIVDDIYDSQEIVVKPLAAQLEGLTVYSGATILGDGKIALIIDVLGLAYRAKAVSKNQKSLQKAKEVKFNSDLKLSKILLCRTIEDGRMAVDLDKVVRLESIDKKAFERVGDSEIIQYRGSVLHIYRALNILPERRKKQRLPEESANFDFLDFLDQDQIHVVIYMIQGLEIGIVVGKILDSVNVDLSKMGSSTRKGVEGTVIFNERVIEILNVEKMVLEADPHFFNKTAIRKVSNG